MRRQACGPLLALCGGLPALFPAAAPPPPPAARGAWEGDESCKVCHPGATRGLEQSVHQVLLRRQEWAARACTACHGDLTAHAAAQSRPGAAPAVAVAPVRAEACAACHAGSGYAPARAAHALPAPRAAPAVPAASAPLLAALDAEAHGDALRWSGLLEAGYRFVHVAGSRDRYATDLDLGPGPRVRVLEARGIGGEDAPVSELSLSAHDLGDPRWDASARAARADAWDLGAGYRRDEFHYRASGDYHRVDRTTGEASADAQLALGRDLQAFATFSRTSDDGFWVTQRIGNRNLPVQTVVDGVASPRRYDGDLAVAGLHGNAAGVHWTAAAEYLDERTVDHWRYAQPATANPAFEEREDFSSRATLRGPGARLAAVADLGPVTLDLAGRYVEHERRIAADGTSAGYDLAEFETVTAASGRGKARTWLFDGSSTLACTDELRVVLDLHWRDHAEDLQLQQTDLTTYPSLGTTVTVATLADQHTAQRLLDGAASIDWSPEATLDLTLGWGFAREWLHVPDLGDPRDFTAGHGRDDGVLAAVRWSFDRDWTLRADLRDFGIDGVPLHELVPTRARAAGGALLWQRGGDHATVFVRHRHDDNDGSQHRYDTFATGLAAGLGKDDLQLDASYTFTRTDTRTLTNFYFDPDPNPVPTLVGFTGDTHTVAGTLVATPCAAVRWQFTVAWTTTAGSFDVSLLDWRGDLQWRVAPPDGVLGCEYRQAWYRDQDRRDDWDAALLFLYWRQTF